MNHESVDGRRKFLKQGGLLLGSLALKQLTGSELLRQQDKETPWTEVTPLEQAGADYLGSEKFAGTKKLENGETKEYINEVRAYELPPNPDFPQTTPLAICSRRYYPDLETDQDAIISYGGIRVLFLPHDNGNQNKTEKHDLTLKFGKYELGVNVLEGEVGKGELPIWNSHYFYKSQIVQQIGVDALPWKTDVAHAGKSKIYGNRATFFTNEEFVRATATGNQVTNERTLLFEADGQWASVPTPPEFTGDKVQETTIAKAGNLILVEGLTDKPYSLIGRPMIEDGSGWSIRELGGNNVSLLTRFVFGNELYELNQNLIYAPKTLEEAQIATTAISQMWEQVGIFMEISKTIPFLDVDKSEVDLTLACTIVIVGNGIMGRESRVALVNPDDLQYNPQPIISSDTESA